MAQLMSTLAILFITSSFLKIGETINVIVPESSTIRPTSQNLELASRSSRTLLKKIHSGAAFLTGYKLGSYLANKGLTTGTGSFSSAHSFQLFGKSVSTALSLAYGGVGIGLQLPLHDPIDNSTSLSRRPTENVIHVTLENPSPDFLENLKALARVSESKGNATQGFRNFSTPTTSPRTFTDFVNKHNSYVNKFNNEKFSNRTRINSRF